MFSITAFKKNRIRLRSPYRSRHFRCISRKSSSRSCKFKSSKKLQQFLPNEHRIQHAPQLKFTTKETRRKLGRVNFREDFWDYYQRQEENWPIADRRVPSNHPRNNCETYFGPSSPLVSKKANSNLSESTVSSYNTFPQHLLGQSCFQGLSFLAFSRRREALVIIRQISLIISLLKENNDSYPSFLFFYFSFSSVLLSVCFH